MQRNEQQWRWVKYNLFHSKLNKMCQVKFYQEINHRVLGVCGSASPLGHWEPM